MRATVRHLLFILFLPAAVLVSCTSDDFIIGYKYIDSDIKTVIIDTCTVKLTTIPVDQTEVPTRVVLLDKETSNNRTLMFGAYTNPVLGWTKATSYITFEAPGFRVFPEADIKFDSVKILMKPNGAYLGDTTSVHNYKICQLSAKISDPLDKKFYSSDTVAYNDDPNIPFSVKPSPRRNKQISVRLDDSFGSDMLEKIVKKDNSIKEQQDFQTYFKGLAITSEDDEMAVLGIYDSTVVIRIYYHFSMVQRDTSSLDISLLKKRSFFGVKATPSTMFEGLKDGEVPSSESGNSAMARALVPSYIKIEFPYLNNLLELGDFGAVTDATLLIYPVKGTYSAEVPLPEELYLYQSKEDSPITNARGNTYQTGNLVVDKMYNINTFYSYDITSFIQDQIDAFDIYRRHLQLTIPGGKIATSFNTLVAGDGNNQTNRIKLKLSYLIYNGK